MLKIYHVRGTRSVRPIWLCYELGVPVDVQTIDFSPSYRATPEWRSLSPAGKVPVMTDGDLTMFESGAMVEYILERYGEGRLRPAAGSAESAMHHQWCWFSEATLLRPLGLHRLLKTPTEDQASVAVDGRDKARVCLAAVEQALQDRDYLLGSEFGAVDIMMGYSLQLLAHDGVLDDSFSNANSYLARLQERSGYQRATTV